MALENLTSGLLVGKWTKREGIPHLLYECRVGCEGREGIPLERDCPSSAHSVTGHVNLARKV